MIMKIRLEYKIAMCTISDGDVELIFEEYKGII